MKLQKEIEIKVQGLGSRSNNAMLIINYLFNRPIVDAQMANQITKLSLPSVYKLINELEEFKIYEQIKNIN